MAKSIRKRRPSKLDKPPKPYPDFPLGAANNGQWVKRINGKLFRFGAWGRVVDGRMSRLPGDGWKAALELDKAQADDLHAGRTPRVTGDRLTVGDLCNRYLSFKEHRLNSGEITRRTFDEYFAGCAWIVSKFGKDRLVDDLAADDFGELRAEMAEQWGPVKLSKEIQLVKSLFKFAVDEGLIERPVRFGQQFQKPSAAVLRKHRAKSGRKMLDAEELRRLIDAAPPQFRAMILLGLNCGFGPHDCATLPKSAVDLDSGFINYPRPKTGIERRCPLWPETAAALRESLDVRPTPQKEEAEGLVFVTTRGRSFLSRGIANPISVAIRDLMKQAGIHRTGIGAYALRHVFRTVADAARDQVAVNHVMGHVDDSMGAAYREGIDDHRLIGVADHVREWLFGDTGPDDWEENQHLTCVVWREAAEANKESAPDTPPEDTPPTLRVVG